jgi:hypothetical protein
VVEGGIHECLWLVDNDVNCLWLKEHTKILTTTTVMETIQKLQKNPKNIVIVRDSIFTGN